MNASTAIALALTLAATALPAQASPQISKGARVRVWQVAGTLQSLQGDTTVIAPDSAPGHPITFSDGQQLEMSLGLHGHGGTGALTGALVGLVFMHEEWQSCGRCKGEVPIVVALLGIAGGGSLGAIIGSLIRTEAWVPVQTAGIRIVVGPYRAGFTVTF